MTDKVKWRDAKHLHEKIAKLTEARARDAETIKAAEALAECVMTAIDYAQDVANGYLWYETKKGEMDALVRLPKSSGLDDLMRFKEALAAFRAAQEKSHG